MLPENLRKFISNPNPFLQKKYPKYHTDKGEKERFEVHSRKFDLVSNLLLPPEKTRGKISKVHAEIDEDLLTRYLNNELSVNELKTLGIGNKKSAVNLKLVQRFQEQGWICTDEAINKLLIYLEVPYGEWKLYYFLPKPETSQADEKATETISNKKGGNRLNNLPPCWNAYAYDPNHKNVYQLPFVIEKISETTVAIFMRGINSDLYTGSGEFFGNYLVCTLFNEKKTHAINLQTFINNLVLQQECILNTACIWIQDTGKPMLSVIILYKSKRQYSKGDLPKIEVKDIKLSQDISVQRVNHFIEYVSKKGEPELAPRWFKPNNFDTVKNRNRTNIITVKFTRPREEFNKLSDFFTKHTTPGQWWSFSRIHNDLSPEHKRVSVFQWSFKSIKNRKIIEVQRLSRSSDEREYEGIIQYKQYHVSIYFTSNDGYKHFLCPLPTNLINEHNEHHGSPGSKASTVLLGSSSTLHENTSYLVKEMLVYTNMLDKNILNEGFISLDKFLKFDFLTDEQKDYIRIREQAVFYKQSAF